MAEGYGHAGMSERAARGAALLRRAGAAALDALVPPVSPLSPAPSDGPGRIEAEHWSKLRFLDAPWCDLCGLPFPYEAGEGALCAVCAAKAPRFDRARSALVYDEASRPLILAFKHGGRRDALSHFAGWMARAARGAEADIVAPVPLHYLRLVHRRYNQSALLGRALAGRMGLEFDAGLLVRTRRTGTQAGRSASGRRRNVAGAFAAPEKARGRLAGRGVLLVDDVYTTGATLNGCARALKRAGAARVEVVTLARVVRPGDPMR